MANDSFGMMVQRAAVGADMEIGEARTDSPTQLNYCKCNWLRWHPNNPTGSAPSCVHFIFLTFILNLKNDSCQIDFIPVLNVLGALHVFPHQLHGDHPQRFHLPHTHPRSLEVSF